MRTNLGLAAIAAISLAMSGCAGILTPERCEAAARAATTLSQVIDVLIANGVEPEKAAQLAAGVLAGQVAIAAACATVANPVPAPVPPGIIPPAPAQPVI